MKIFVSGKVGDESEAREVMAHLARAGHEVTLDWTTIEHLKPYDENTDASAKAAALEVQGVKEADVLVVIAHDRGVGMYVELGVALGSAKPVYVVSKRPSRSMFFHHPLVTVVRSVDELTKRLNAIGPTIGHEATS